MEINSVQGGWWRLPVRRTSCWAGWWYRPGLDVGVHGLRHCPLEAPAGSAFLTTLGDRVFNLGVSNDHQRLLADRRRVHPHRSC